jgi:peptide/nickel transport system ATP-binding protein
MNESTLLGLESVSVSYATSSGRIKALSDVTLSIKAGTAFGLVGESGCGKTTLAKAIIQLLPPNGRIVKGSVNFDGQNLTRLSSNELRQVRGKEIAIVPQSAMNSLNPVYRVGDQLVETMVVRGAMTNAEARQRAIDLFEKVDLDPSRLHDYPHQYSGGMKQRAIIALAMALSPKLIIADEPTTALDVLVEARILDLLSELKDEYRLTLTYITHDLSVVARTCGVMGVMYAGKLVELGPTSSLINEPHHPYSMGLIAAVPRSEDRSWKPVSIPGSPPDLLDPPPGCRFAERCPFAEMKCFEEVPNLDPIDGSRMVACHFADMAYQFMPKAMSPDVWEGTLASRRAA